MARRPADTGSQAEWPLHPRGGDGAVRGARGVRRRRARRLGQHDPRQVVPPAIAMVNVTVARAHERAGRGGALYRALVATLPHGDRDDRAGRRRHRARVARDRRAPTASRSPSTASSPSSPSSTCPSRRAGPGVTLEDVCSLEFPDEEAVEAMLLDSQTNPEADEGFVSTLATYREIAAKVERPDRRPGAGRRRARRDHRRRDRRTACWASPTPASGRAFRGRGLAFALKQYGHRLAADAGATVCYTMNEEANTGIRHVNAKLGYQVIGGVYRLRRPPDSS